MKRVDDFIIDKLFQRLLNYLYWFPEPTARQMCYASTALWTVIAALDLSQRAWVAAAISLACVMLYTSVSLSPIETGHAVRIAKLALRCIWCPVFLVVVFLFVVLYIRDPSLISVVSALVMALNWVFSYIVCCETPPPRRIEQLVKAPA